MRFETVLTLDERSTETLDELRRTLKAKSKSEVMRRAITLLLLATATADNHGHVILKDAAGTEREVIVI